MNLPNVLTRLKRMEERSEREGYGGDAARIAAQRHTLILLNEIAGKMTKKKRTISAWNVFVSEYLKSGKTIKEAAEDWKKKAGQTVSDK